VPSYDVASNICQPLFGGTLFVTERHACFDLEERSGQKPSPVVVEYGAVAAVQRVRAPPGGGQGPTLVHFAAQPEPFLKQRLTLHTP